MKPTDVPAGPVLVDTDVISYWITRHQQGQAFSRLLAGHDQAVSFATYGELLANAHGNHWGPRRLAELRNRLKAFVVLPYTAQAVELWAEMHAKLSGHLHNGGTNDLWTAACALTIRPRLAIATNNLKDYQAIARAFPDLQIIHPDL